MIPICYLCPEANPRAAVRLPQHIYGLCDEHELAFRHWKQFQCKATDPLTHRRICLQQIYLRADGKNTGFCLFHAEAAAENNDHFYMSPFNEPTCPSCHGITRRISTMRGNSYTLCIACEQTYLSIVPLTLCMSGICEKSRIIHRDGNVSQTCLNCLRERPSCMYCRKHHCVYRDYGKPYHMCPECYKKNT